MTRTRIALIATGILWAIFVTVGDAVQDWDAWAEVWGNLWGRD